MIQIRLLNILHLAFLWLVMATAALAATPAASIEKPPADVRDYQFLKLENGLSVLVVSDPVADKAAAAMDVGVGSMADPDDRAGLAHFVEHMLFLGTQKYPEPGEYQSFISRHGGSHNAMTSQEFTNYFFDIEPAYLRPALERFSQQFTAPLFTASLVDRERHAVHSEFTAKIKDDNRRAYSAMQQAFSAGHPAAKFSVGNTDTLANTEERPLRDDAIAFYRRYYSAPNMRLVIIGRESTETLALLAKTYFSDLPAHPVAPATANPPFYPEDKLPRLLEIQTLQDDYEMSVEFPTLSTRDDYVDKPAWFVAHLLGHEGPGSLLDVLRRAGLATGLSAGTRLDDGTHATFGINVSLTPAGKARWREVLALSFDAIDLIRREGIDRRFFDEERTLLDIASRYRSKMPAIHEASMLAGRLRHIPAHDILMADYRLNAYQPSKYQTLLNALQPSRAMVTLSAPDTLGDARQSPWYDTPYRLSELSLEPRPDTTALRAQLALPGPNPFVPEHLAMLPGKTMAHPEPLSQHDGFRSWYAFDTDFGYPKSSTYVSIRSVMANNSPESNVMTSLLARDITEQLNPFSYAATLAGLSFDLYPHVRGLTVKVEGYSEKSHTLLQQVLQSLVHPRFDPARFERLREALVRELDNRRFSPLFQQAGTAVQEFVVSPSWSTDSLISAATSIRFDDYVKHHEQVFAHTDVVALHHGNLSHASALNTDVLLKRLLMRQPSQVSAARVRNLTLTQRIGLPLDIPQPDAVISLYVQGDDTSYDEKARYLLLWQLIESAFYERLRTQQQLGYVVFASPLVLQEVPGLSLVVQSPVADANDLATATETFLREFAPKLEALDAGTFERYQQALLSRLLQADETLFERSERFWREIDRGNDAFDSREQTADAVKQQTQAGIIGFYSRTLLHYAPRVMAFKNRTAGPDDAKAPEPLAGYLPPGEQSDVQFFPSPEDLRATGGTATSATSVVGHQ